MSSQKWLDKRRAYDNLNGYSKVLSSMTAFLRFKEELNVDLNDFNSN